MGNRVISYSLKGIEVFLKLPVIIIMKFGENNVLGRIHINIHISVGFDSGLHGSAYIFCLLFINTEKVQEHDLS